MLRNIKFLFWLILFITPAIAQDIQSPPCFINGGTITCGSNSLTPATSPGGSNTQVQFNDNGVFAGNSLFTFNKATNVVSANVLNIGGGSPNSNALAVTGTAAHNAASAASTIMTFADSVQSGLTSINYPTFSDGNTTELTFFNNQSEKNVIALQNQHTHGHSAMTFVDSSLSPRGSVGYSNPSSTAVTADAVYIESFIPNSGSVAARPFMLTQTGHNGTGYATYVRYKIDALNTGSHRWYDNANNLIMTLDASGDLGLGRTPTSQKMIDLYKPGGSALMLMEGTLNTGDNNLAIKNDVGNVSALGLYGSTRTAYGAIAAGAVYLYGNSTTMAIVSDNASGAIVFGVGASVPERARINSTALQLASGIQLNWNNDLFLTRPMAASIQYGASDAAVAVAQTTRVQSVVAGTAAANGANWTLIGSLPTGTGTSGDIIFQTGVKTGSGTTQGTATTALTIKGETQQVIFGGTASGNSGGSSGSINTQGGIYAGGNNYFGGNLTVTSGGSYKWDSRVALSSPADGNLLVQVAAATNGFKLGASATDGLLTLGTSAGGSGNALGSLNLTNLTATGTISGAALNISGASVLMPALASDGGATDATVCVKTSDGTILKGSGTLGICLGTSSERYKTEIEPIDVGLSEILLLKSKKFYLDKEHGDPTKQMYGFTAEDCAKILPKLTEFDNFNQPNTCDYLGVVPVLVRAIQQQQAKIDALERRLN